MNEKNEHATEYKRKMKQTPPPQKIEAEQAVLGTILIKGEVINQVLNNLTKEDFYLDKHKKIFDSMIKMNDDGKPIDLITIIEFMNSDGNLMDAVGGSSYLTHLTEVVPTTEEEYPNDVSLLVIILKTTKSMQTML